MNDAQAPRVAIDPQGNVAVIWNQLEAAGSQFDVGAALRTAAGDWSSPGFAESDNAYFGWAYSSGGGVGALGGGAFVGTWRVFPGSPAISGYAFINRYTPGSGWGAPVIPLDEDRGTTLFEPQIVANGAGAGIATWFEVGAINRTDIVASLLVGEPAAPAVVVSRGAAAAIEYHAAAMNASGDAVVVWAEVGATRRDVWVRRLAGGTWQTPTLVNTSTVGDADTPHVAINDAGDVVVVWWQPGANGASATWARTFTVAGGWGSAAEIGPNLVNNTRVALDAAGNAIATWEAGGDTLRGNYSIRAARYEKGVGWGAPVILSAPDDEGGNALNPDLAMDAAGNAVVVWPTGQYPQSAASIWANRYHAGIGWDCPHVIETDPQPTDRPRVAMNGTGRAVVAWQRQDVADGSDGLHDAWANVLE
ncbi:MAG: hypothetical protein FJ104_16380 [Deltaproteobacteria bacterium]|nr:hypothetical protein [Deltaproteobacteria bacterium]